MPTIAQAHRPTFEEYAVVAWPSLYRHAYLLSGNHADAEDLAQQTLIKAHGAWSRVSGAESPHPTCAASSPTPSCPRSDPRDADSSCWPARPAPEPVGPPVVGPEDRMALWPHVRALPPRQRAVVVLRYYEQLSEAEIADALGCSRGNVKSTAHRALQNLRTALDGGEV